MVINPKEIDLCPLCTFGFRHKNDWGCGAISGDSHEHGKSGIVIDCSAYVRKLSFITKKKIKKRAIHIKRVE